MMIHECLLTQNVENMSYPRRFLLFVFTVLSLMSGYAQSKDADRETMYQVATLQSLMVGNYDGFVSVSELRQHGDIGVGTFERIDGEMIVLDGTVYQARYDGSVRKAYDNIGVPFATVTYFDCDTVVTVDRIDDLKSLAARLDETIDNTGRNLIYAVRIDVSECKKVVVRSEVPQDKPYRMLAETMTTAQREFSYENIGGTIVAVYFPSFFASQNAPGWHFHFISDERTKGGHVLDLSVGIPVKVRIDATPYFNLYMPEKVAFSHRKLDMDLSKDIQKVE